MQILGVPGLSGSVSEGMSLLIPGSSGAFAAPGSRAPPPEFAAGGTAVLPGGLLPPWSERVSPVSAIPGKGPPVSKLHGTIRSVLISGKSGRTLGSLPGKRLPLPETPILKGSSPSFGEKVSLPAFLPIIPAIPATPEAMTASPALFRSGTEAALPEIIAVQAVPAASSYGIPHS